MLLWHSIDALVPRFASLPAYLPGHRFKVSPSGHHWKCWKCSIKNILYINGKIEAKKEIFLNLYNSLFHPSVSLSKK